MTIEYVKVKCAYCGKWFDKQKRLLNMCEINYCNAICRRQHKWKKN